MTTKYLISHYGAGIAVGLTQEEGAEEDINLAHNLFNATCHETILQGTILFNSIKQFRRFLAYKYFFANRFPFEKNEFGLWRRAFRNARRVLKENCRADNFMLNMVAANTQYHGQGEVGRSTEVDHEC